MENHSNTTSISELEEVLKQIVHEETEVQITTKAVQNEEKTTPDQHSLEFSLKRRLDELPEKDDKVVPLTIFRIPANIRERDKMFYEPQVVSIGPFYRGRVSLRAMEEQKVYLLRDFLARYNDVNLELLVEEMRLLEEAARLCYAESVDLNSRQFVEMLLLDGCFILENAIKWFNNEPNRLRHARWATETIVSDLLLVENQIPFFVVMKLISMVQDDDKKSFDLVNLLATYIGSRRLMDMVPVQVEVHSLSNSRSLIHFYYQLFVPERMSYQRIPKQTQATSSRRRLFSSFKSCIFPQPAQGDAKQIDEEPVYVFPCVIELLQSGLKFKPKKSPTDLLDITFQDGIVEMPPLWLCPINKVIFLNVVAFEQTNGEDVFLPFSSYVALMENLVKTSKDVVALRQCGIIYTFDPNEEEAALFFNHAGQVAVLDYSNHYFASLFREIKDYFAVAGNKLKTRAQV